MNAGSIQKEKGKAQYKTKKAKAKRREKPQAASREGMLDREALCAAKAIKSSLALLSHSPLCAVLRVFLRSVVSARSALVLRFSAII